MGAQRLSDRKVQRIAESTGLDVICGWTHGGYIFSFVTTDHKHGVWNSKSGEWAWEPDAAHYTSCKELFPGNSEE